MSSQDLADRLRASNGKIVRVTFIKRTTGEVRVLVGRLGVKSHLKGGERAYDFEEKGLVSIFDMQKRAYRCVPTESILELCAEGETLPANS